MASPANARLAHRLYSHAATRRPVPAPPMLRCGNVGRNAPVSCAFVPRCGIPTPPCCRIAAYRRQCA